MDRRGLLKTVLLGASALVLRPRLAIASNADDATAKLAALERQHGGRLGVSILDTGNGHRMAHRGDERFLMCSTFKLMAVATVLARVDRGSEKLDRRIVFGKDVVLSYAPITSHRVGAPGMSVAELCQAAITVSDNTAANLLLTSLGGPAAVTAFVRSLGDPLTRLDRTEPDLNIASPGDVRDTTTPNAMLATMQKVLLGNALADSSREQLLAWLRACSTGADKLRAGVPAGWTVGDKTGSGAQNETNDIGILYPPQRKPLLVTVYYRPADTSVDAAARNAVIAAVGHIAAAI